MAYIHGYFGITAILEVALNLVEAGRFIPPGQLSLYAGLFFGASVTAFLEAFHRIMSEVGFDGYLATASSQGVNIERVDFMESKAVHGSNKAMTCQKLLSP